MARSERRPIFILRQVFSGPRRFDTVDPLVATSIAIAAVAVLWIGLTFFVEMIRFAAISPELQVAIEAAASFSRIFGALVLFLYAGQHEKSRLHWMALSLSMLGLSGLVFGYILPATFGPLSYNTSILVSGYVWSVSAALIAIGYLPGKPPPFGRAQTRILLFLVIASIPMAVWVAGDSPQLVNVSSFELAARTDHTILRGLTMWHWVFSAVPLGIAVAGLVGVYLRMDDESVGQWLLLAMTLWVCAQLHNLFWPSGYVPILTTASVFRLGFSAVIAISGVIGWHDAAIAFRRLADDRAALLTSERESAQRLSELSRLRGEFTSMVAHELGNPVAAIRRQTELLAWEHGSDSPRFGAYTSILAETDLLDTLIRDVQDIAAMERTDFPVQLTSIPAGVLVADAAAFGESLAGDHSVVASTLPTRVRADPDRIGQVLRNLVVNAANYSGAGTPIEITSTRFGGAVRLAVTDHGPGVPAHELEVIFDKFTRGLRGKESIGGTGLGLYVAKRIVEAHGSQLSISSVMGQGSTFWFDLQVSP